MGQRTTHNRTHRLTRRSALRGHTLSSREERVWRKTRQRTHGSLETPSLCGYRLRLDESVPDEFAWVPSPNSNQRRCSRALSGVPYRRGVLSNPVETQVQESVLFHWFSAASCILHTAGSLWVQAQNPSWEVAPVQNPSVKIGDFDTSPCRGGFGRKLLVPPERGDAPKGQRGKRGNPSGGIAATSPCRGGFAEALFPNYTNTGETLEINKWSYTYV